MGRSVSAALVVYFAFGSMSQEATNAPARKVSARPGPTNAAPATAWQVPTNRILEFQVPLTIAARTALLNAKHPAVQFAAAGVAVPPGFNPTNAYPVLIVSATSDGDGSSIRAMRSFTNSALKLGWVVLAADGPYGKPPNDNPAWRFAMLSSVLEHVHKAWPESRKWPVACAGFSGGAKWAGVLGAALSMRGYKLIGVFMSACNEDKASEAARLYHPATRFKETPIYLSSGSDDKIATPQHHEAVRQSLLDNGFSTVRIENYTGGHGISPPELQNALTWFMELYKAKAGSTGSPEKTAAPADQKVSE